MTLSKLDFRNPRHRGRRRGVAFVYLALIMVILLGMTGLVVDVGQLHMKEAQARRAADAAALAGAMQLPDTDKALEEALRYAKLNKYDDDAPGVTVTGVFDEAFPNRYTVSVQRPERLFFIRVLLRKEGTGPRTTQVPVGATATAEFVQAGEPVNIEMGGTYGASGATNLSVFGPHSEYQHGDPYSPRWRDDRGTLNDDNEGHNGYDFKLVVPNDYSTRNENSSIVNVELFDADTYNSDGKSGPNGLTEWDEIRDPYSGSGQQPISKFTTTRYSLYKVVDPNDPSKDTFISDAVYGNDPATNNQTNNKWVTPDGFSFDLNTYGPGAYRINVKTEDGSSENGFNLRAGPPRAENQEFKTDNGTHITATGRIPINFNTSGETKIALGEVPAEAAGGQLIIEKFDTDVDSKSVVYTSIPPASNEPPGGWTGRLAENAQWLTDDPIKLPADYQTAQWFATYTAGWQDTSVWKMSYTNTKSGTPGTVRLIGRNGKPY